jgi:ribose 5-phosphate isomerase A
VQALWGEGTAMAVEERKREAGVAAVEAIRDGMVVGLGSGSTARFATLRLAEKLRAGELRDIIAIPTSVETATLARREGIPLTSLEARGQVDVTIDGADEVDPDLNVIKGLGGFLLREKIVAFATRQEIIVVDDSKLVERLGTKSPVPVEVIRFGWHNTRRALERTGAEVTQRFVAGEPYVTDEGNFILDCRYPGIEDPAALAAQVNAIPGVVENGLFLGMVQRVVVASAAGVRVIEV